MKERPKSWRHLELILGIVQFQFEHFWFMSPVSLALPVSKHVLSKEKQQLVGKEAGSRVQKKRAVHMEQPWVFVTNSSHISMLSYPTNKISNYWS